MHIISRKQPFFHIKYPSILICILKTTFIIHNKIQDKTNLKHDRTKTSPHHPTINTLKTTQKTLETQQNSTSNIEILQTGTSRKPLSARCGTTRPN